MPRESSSPDFYVYVLFDWRGVPRYVGKGRNGRWTQHQTEKPNRKTFIDETIAALGSLPRIKVRENLTEHSAYSIEHALIKALGREPIGPLVNRTDKGSGPNSQQVKSWHAKRSPEERRAHMQPATDASVASVTKEQRRESIRYAHAARTPEQNIASAARLNAAYTPEKRKAASAKRIAGMTPEARSAAAKKAIASQSKEQLSETGRRRNEYITPEKRSEIGKKRSANMSAEQREQNASRIRNSQTKEQLSLNGKKGAASLTAEQRSEMARKRAQTLGPERRREIAMIAVEARRRKKRELSQ